MRWARWAAPTPPPPTSGEGRGQASCVPARPPPGLLAGMRPLQGGRWRWVLSGCCILHSTSPPLAPHRRLSCPALRVPAALIEKHEALAFAVLAALRPAERLQAVVTRAKEHLWGLGGVGGRAFTVLHLKADEGWEARCRERWGRSGAPPDNCDTNTEAVGAQLEARRVDRSAPLLLVTSWARANLSLVQDAIGSLQAHG